MSSGTTEPDFWAISYLKLPPELREEGRRAVALNFCTNMESGLNKDWERQFETVLAKLKGETASNVTAFRPKAVNSDDTG